MQEDEENDQKSAAQENAGPKIKMGRLGGKKKAGVPDKSGKAAPGAKVDSEKWSKQADKSLGAAGFSEQDIEFMKKAI